jgi:S-adenosylmethionine/arginine decarboxylase-like enzyme
MENVIELNGATAIADMTTRTLLEIQSHPDDIAPIFYRGDKGWMDGAWGLLTSIDVEECDESLIRSADVIRQYVIDLCDLIEMKRFGDCTVVHFGEDERVAGYSMFQLIETSCISGHFANDSNRSYIDIFSCKAYDPKVVAEFTQRYFEGKTTRVNTCNRY